MNIDKTLNIAKKILKILKVLFILNIIVAAAMFFFSINSGFRETASLTTSLTLGVLKISFKNTVPDDFISFDMLTVSCVVVLAMEILFYLTVRKLTVIVDNAIKGEIFSPSSTRSLNLISVYIVIQGVIDLIASFIGNITVNGYIHKLELFNTDIVESVSVNTNYDISFLIIAFVVFVLAKVLAYGEKLQTLSDETL